MRSLWRKLERNTRQLAAFGLVTAVTVLVVWGSIASPDSVLGEYTSAALLSTGICLLAIMGGVFTAMYVAHRNSPVTMRLIQSLTLACAVGLVTMFCTVSRFDGNTVLISRTTGEIRVPSGFAIYNPLEFRPSVYMRTITVTDTEVGYMVRVSPRMTVKELQTKFGSPVACRQVYTTIIHNAAADVKTIPSRIQRLCAIEGRLASLLPNCKVEICGAYTN